MSAPVPGRGPARLDGRRVAVVNWRDLDHPLAGGSEVYAWELARGLRDAGARVTYVTARVGDQPRRLERGGIAVRRGGGRLSFYAHAAAYLLTHRRRLDAVVDPECGIPVFSPLVVRRTTAVLLVLHHVHRDQFATYFPPLLARLGRFLEGWLMPRVYAGRTTVAVSDSTREQMREQLGWTGPVGLLPNGAEVPADEVVAEEKDPDRLVVLGRLVPHKRVDLVLRAFAGLVAARPDRPGLHLDVVGRGPEAARLADLVSDLGLGGRVTLHGYLDDDAKAAVLRRAALHVCASDIEGWGQVVVEAAAYGVPTLARDVPGLRDSIRDGVTGWLLPESGARHGDLAPVVPALVAGLDAALADLGERPATESRHLAAKACRAWAEEHSWARTHAEAARLVATDLARHAG